MYTSITELHRTNTKLLLSIIKPFNPVSKDTLSKWVKFVLHQAGIDMDLFSPHSIRSASTSYAKNCLPLDTILKAGGWRSMKTFTQYYDKPIETRDSNFAYNILKKGLSSQTI